LLASLTQSRGNGAVQTVFQLKLIHAETGNDAPLVIDTSYWGDQVLAFWLKSQAAALAPFTPKRVRNDKSAMLGLLRHRQYW